MCLCVTTGLGPGNKDISCRVTDSGSGNFKVDYTPTVAGKCYLALSAFLALCFYGALVVVKHGMVLNCLLCWKWFSFHPWMLLYLFSEDPLNIFAGILTFASLLQLALMKKKEMKLMCCWCLGDYIIEISCFGLPIPASPFTAKAWDVSKVVVSNVTAGRVGCQSMFNSKISRLNEI